MNSPPSEGSMNPRLKTINWTRRTKVSEFKSSSLPNYHNLYQLYLPNKTEFTSGNHITPKLSLVTILIPYCQNLVPYSVEYVEICRVPLWTHFWDSTMKPRYEHVLSNPNAEGRARTKAKKKRKTYLTCIGQIWTRNHSKKINYIWELWFWVEILDLSLKWLNYKYS